MTLWTIRRMCGELDNIRSCLEPKHPWRGVLHVEFYVSKTLPSRRLLLPGANRKCALIVLGHQLADDWSYWNQDW